MTWWVVANPRAGRGRSVVDRAAAALAAGEIRHRLLVPEGVAEIPTAVAEGVAAGHRDFAVVGGDGTAHHVLNALLGERWEEPPTLAILPAGSGCDFIRTFGLPRTLEGAVAHLGDGARYRCDVGALEGGFGRRLFLNAANVGVAAAAARWAGRLPRRLGAARYTAGFWLALGGFPPADVVVETERGRWSGSMLEVVLANGQFFGGGLNVAPRAAAGDGVLDVQAFLGPRWRAFDIMPRIIRGNHLGRPGVRRCAAARISVRCPASWPVEADGEPVGTGPVTVGVWPGAFDLKI